MDILIGSVVCVFLLLLIVGAVTGRVRFKGCCSIADPRLDLRMRGAFEDPAEESTGLTADR